MNLLPSMNNFVLIRFNIRKSRKNTWFLLLPPIPFNFSKILLLSILQIWYLMNETKENCLCVTLFIHWLTNISSVSINFSHCYISWLLQEIRCWNTSWRTLLGITPMRDIKWRKLDWSWKASNYSDDLKSPGQSIWTVEQRLQIQKFHTGQKSFGFCSAVVGHWL